MKYCLSFLVICCLFLSLGQSSSQEGDNQSNQPFFVPKNPSYNSDWVTLAKYYGPFLIVPIALGILLSIVLTCLNCVTCCCSCCSKKLCGPPCCLNSKSALAILYTIEFAILTGACVAAWYHAPLFTEGVNVIVVGISSTVGDVVDFVEKSADKIRSIASDLQDSLIPAFDNGALNSTTDQVHDLISRTRIILGQMNDSVVTLDSLYAELKTEIEYIDTEKQNLGITAETPSPSDLPDINLTDAFNISRLEEGLDQIEKDANSLATQIENSIRDPDNYNLPPDYNFFPNFTLPFNFSSLLDKLDFGVNKILELTGLSNPMTYLNETMSSIPFTYEDFEYIGNIVDENGGVYTLVVSIVGASIVIAYFIWYFGFCGFPIIHRVPFCWSAFIVIFLGVAVGIHLAFGTISNDFCTQRYDIISDGAKKALEIAESKNLSPSVMGPLRKLLKNPDLLLNCSGNQTIFALYNISLWDDLGFADIIGDLLNGTSLPDFFPNNSSVDEGVKALLDQQQNMNNSLFTYQSQIPEQYNLIIALKSDLQNKSDMAGCPAAPIQYCTDAAALNQSIDHTLSLYDQISPEISHLLNLTNDLNGVLEEIKNARRSIVDTLAESLNFPDLNSSLASDILQTLGECSWFGYFWTVIVGDALCTKISPALLWVGWCFAVVGLCMILLTPVIVWSLNLEDNGLL